MKVCTKCKIDKEEKQFSIRVKAKDGLQNRCKSCVNLYDQNRYKTNPEFRKELRKHLIEIRNIKREFICKYLETHPCVDCGESDLIVLEFDHTQGIKSFNIANASRDGTGLNRLVEEIEKCEVRCANCHRKMTALRDGTWWKTKRPT